MMHGMLLKQYELLPFSSMKTNVHLLTFHAFSLETGNKITVYRYNLKHFLISDCPLTGCYQIRYTSKPPKV